MDIRDKTILYVEDNFDAARHVTWQIEKEVGCHVVCFHNGDEAIQAIEEGLQYNLLLIDLQLEYSRVNGPEVIEKSREKNPSKLVMVLSGVEPCDVPPKLADRIVGRVEFYDCGCSKLKEILEMGHI